MEFHNLSLELIKVLIYIPIIATFTNFGRYILGIKTLGIYPTMVITLTLLFASGLQGFVIVFLVCSLTMIVHSLLRNIRMHYISRVATNYAIVSVFLLLIIYVFTKIPFVNSYFLETKINPLSILLITTLSDFIIKEYLNKDFIGTARDLIETLLIGIVSWLVISNDFLINLIIKHAWIIPIFILINFMIGKSTNLRLMDLLRFKNLIFSKPEQDEEDKN